jgi:hypothetical protein
VWFSFLLSFSFFSRKGMKKAESAKLSTFFFYSGLRDGGAKPRVALFIFEVVVFGVPAVEAAGAGIAGAWLNLVFEANVAVGFANAAGLQQA